MRDACAVGVLHTAHTARYRGGIMTVINHFDHDMASCIVCSIPCDVCDVCDGHRAHHVCTMGTQCCDADVNADVDVDDAIVHVARGERACAPCIVIARGYRVCAPCMDIMTHYIRMGVGSTAALRLTADRPRDGAPTTTHTCGVCDELYPCVCDSTRTRPDGTWCYDVACPACACIVAVLVYTAATNDAPHMPRDIWHAARDIIARTRVEHARVQLLD